MKLQTANVKAGLGHEAIPGITEQMRAPHHHRLFLSSLIFDGMTSVPRALSSNIFNINNPVSILGSSILQLINGETDVQNAAEILSEPQESNVWMCDAEVKR